MYTLKVQTKTNELTITDIVEFVWGKKYFFYRKADGQTQTLLKNNILEVERKILNGEFRMINIPKR